MQAPNNLSVNNVARTLGERTIYINIEKHTLAKGHSNAKHVGRVLLLNTIF